MILSRVIRLGHYVLHTLLTQSYSPVFASSWTQAMPRKKCSDEAWHAFLVETLLTDVRGQRDKLREEATQYGKVIDHSTGRCLVGLTYLHDLSTHVSG